MKAAILLWAMLAASPCLAQGPPVQLAPRGLPAPVDEAAVRKKLAIDAYHDCLAKAAAALDDRISDASSVGMGVGSACRGKMRDYAVIASGGSAQLESSLVDTLSRNLTADATAAVLAARAFRAKRQAPTPKPKPKGEGI